MDRYITKHLNKLMLDPNNYRFIDNKEYSFIPEDQISNDRIQKRTYNLLVGKNESYIEDLISSFKANGILKLDPIQVKPLENGNYIVIEGNRRTATLKYLYEQYKKGNDIGVLSETDFKSIELIQISDESPTQHLITMGLHHISGKRKWSPVNQAKLVNDLRYEHNLSEEDICDKLAITKHSLRRSLRVHALINLYKDSDYGDQFHTNMYSVFEEIIKNTRVKSWLGWDDGVMEPKNKERQELLFSWISKEVVNEQVNEGSVQEITYEPIITKSHEIRELSKFINDEKALEEMVEARSITAGFVLSEAVGESRLKNAIENISKEIQKVFKFSEHMDQEEQERLTNLNQKIKNLLPQNNASIDISQRKASLYFKNLNSHFSEISIKEYRKLEDIHLKNLGRVNIFAGGNNTGKTSFLELIFLFTRLNTIQELIKLEKFRGRFFGDFPTKWFDKVFVKPIRLESRFNGSHCSLNVTKFESDESFEKSHYLNSILAESSIDNDSFTSTIHLFSNKDPELYFEKSLFLCEATFSSPYRFDDELLKKAHAQAVEEQYFERIIQFIKRKLDPRIQKIEMVNIDSQSRFMVSSESIPNAIDITKYGEGLQRVFEIALLMGYSRDGIICIDELDSALHKSLLIDFTEFIQAFAKDFNVQVFVSTHSKECIDAFVQNDYPDDELTAFSLEEENEKIICRYLQGNKLKRLVESMNIDIR